MATADTEDKLKNYAGKNPSGELADEIDAIRSDIENLTNTVTRIAKGKANRAQDMAREQVGWAQDKAYETAHEAEEAIRRNPLSSVAIALGLGFLFGIITSR